MRLTFLALSFFALAPTVFFAQQSARMDSILNSNATYIDIVIFLRQKFTEKELENALQNENKEKAKVKLINALCWKYFASNPQKALEYAKMQMELAVKLKDKNALETGYDNFGFLYKSFGEYEKSISYHLKSLQIKEEKKDSSGISVCMNGIGGLYFTMQNFPKALDYFIKGTHIDSLLNSNENLIDNYGNIGACYDAMQQYSKALEYYIRAEDLSKKISRKISSDLLQNLGTAYLKKGELQKAEEYLNKAHEAATKENDVGTIIVINIAFADLYSQKKEYEKAINYGEKALGLAKQNKLIDSEIEALKSLANIYSQARNYSKAFQYQQMFSNLKDTLLTEKNGRAITEMNTKYETEKKEKQIEIQNLTLTQQNLELNKKQIIIYATAGGIALLMTLSFFIFRSYKQKKKANLQLEEKNILIEEKSKIVEEQHKDITDSIKYAQRIQQAILPPAKFWHELLPNSFVLYKPKDILSGDFYWIEQNQDYVYVAAADCTGHGVPGALMSLVNYNLLNKAVLEKNLVKPADILDEVNKSLTISLHQTYNESAVRDGMDVALCALHKGNGQMQFAGAFNGGYIFKKDGSFLDLNGDKTPVGAFIEEKIALFTNHSLPLEKGDRVFIFSDGYADQFGGPKGKKLKYINLKKYIAESLHLDMQQQKKHLEDRFNEWKGKYEQVDDVLVIGFAIA